MHPHKSPWVRTEANKLEQILEQKEKNWSGQLRFTLIIMTLLLALGFMFLYLDRRFPFAG